MIIFYSSLIDDNTYWAIHLYVEKNKIIHILGEKQVAIVRAKITKKRHTYIQWEKEWDWKRAVSATKLTTERSRHSYNKTHFFFFFSVVFFLALPFVLDLPINEALVAASNTSLTP